MVLLSKGSLEQSNTFYAQGGVCAVLAPEDAAPGDSVAAHIADTLAAGAGLNDAEAVRVLCTEAVRDIAGLARYGVHFDLRPDGGPALGLEAAHSAPRILHAGGDATGACIARGSSPPCWNAPSWSVPARAGSAWKPARSSPNSSRTHAGCAAQHGRTTPARVTGVAYLAGGRPQRLAADAVLLATGGAGRLFARTSNPSVATADGLALAWRAGAAVRDLEFFQFHPTTLAAEEIPGGPPALLISEAVRGEGAVLLDAAGLPLYARLPSGCRTRPARRRLPEHRPAPGRHGRPRRTARSTWTPAASRPAAGAGFLARRFPTITAATLAAGYDWTVEPIPVSPAAHYWMGGVCTDLCGAAPPCRACTPPARSPAPACTGPTGWPATRCWRGSCSAAAPWRTSCATVARRMDTAAPAVLPTISADLAQAPGATPPAAPVWSLRSVPGFSRATLFGG